MNLQESLFSKSDLLFLASEILKQSPNRIMINMRVGILTKGETLELNPNKVGFLMSCSANDLTCFSLKENVINIEKSDIVHSNFFFDSVIANGNVQIIYYVFEML